MKLINDKKYILIGLGYGVIVSCIYFVVLILSAVDLVASAEDFDCGENRTITSGYICDGDEDCFWGQDENEDMCNKLSEETSGSMT